MKQEDTKKRYYLIWTVKGSKLIKSSSNNKQETRKTKPLPSILGCQISEPVIEAKIKKIILLNQMKIALK